MTSASYLGRIDDIAEDALNRLESEFEANFVEELQSYGPEEPHSSKLILSRGQVPQVNFEPEEVKELVQEEIKKIDQEAENIIKEEEKKEMSELEKRAERLRAKFTVDGKLDLPALEAKYKGTMRGLNKTYDTKKKKWKTQSLHIVSGLIEEAKKQ